MIEERSISDKDAQPQDEHSCEGIPRDELAMDTCPRLAGETKYPDGGLRAWGVVVGAILSQFCGYGHLSAFGIYQDYYVRIYMTEHSPSAISWIGSVNAFLLISTGFVGGRLYDKGYCSFLLWGGAFLMSFSLFMLSLVKPNRYVEALLCQGFGVGLGGGMMYIPSFAIVSQYFDKRRALALSIVTAGVPLGSTVSPIMMNNLLQRSKLGFARATRIDAAIITTILITSCMLMRPRLPPPAQHTELKKCLKKFARDRAYIILALGFMFFGLGFFFPMFYLQLAATSHGLDKTFAFYSLVILNACAFVARMTGGLIAQVMDVKYQAIVSAAVCGAITFAFISAGSVVSIVFIGVLYGFFTGIYAATMAPLVNLLTDDVAELGIRLGISFACSGLGELIGSPIAGMLLTDEYQWWRPGVFCGIIVLCSSVCFAVVAVELRRRGGH